MKTLIGLFFLACCFNLPASSQSDTLDVIDRMVNNALHHNSDKCYELEISVKPMIATDTLLNQIIVKVFHSHTQNDSLRKFYSVCNNHIGYTNIHQLPTRFDLHKKQASIIHFTDSAFIHSLSNKRTEFFMPLISTHVPFRAERLANQAFSISDTNVSYQGWQHYPDEDIVVKKTINLITKPLFKLVITEEIVDLDPLFNQFFGYQIEEVSSNTSAHFQQSLFDEADSLFSGFTWVESGRQKSDEIKVNTGHKAPYWVGVQLDGDTVKATDVSNRFLVLDFWYMQCHPCWKTIETLSTLNENSNGMDVKIIGVNPIDWKSKAVALELFKKFGGNFTVIFDEKKTMRTDYEVMGFPVVFVIDLKTGEVIFRQNGHSDNLIESITESIQQAQ